MRNYYQTTRLTLNELTLSDAEFIRGLVNTEGWLKFIGDRNVKSLEDATAYIQRIIDNPTATYWVVKLQEGSASMGIITLLKREYLEHYDIGFAFLPQYAGRGYAYEAAGAILDELKKDPAHTHILATTVKDNSMSIKLLEKLGLRFSKKVEDKGTQLLVYSIKCPSL